MAFAENQRFRRVHVLWLSVAQHPARKSDDIAPHVDDREHQPGAEGVIKSAGFAPAHQSRIEQLVIGIALGAHGAAQSVPAVGGEAQSEFHCGLGRYLPLVHVGGGHVAAGSLELVVKISGGVPVQREHPLPLPCLGAVLLLGHGHVGALGQKRHGVREGQVFYLHYKVNHSAALAAAEAVIYLLVRGHGEGRGLFRMERAQPELIGAAFFSEPDITGYHVHYVVALAQLLQKVFRKVQVLTSFL